MSTEVLSPKELKLCLSLLWGKADVTWRPSNTGNLQAVLEQLLAAAEYREAVLKPLLLREPFKDGRFADELALAWVYWAQTRLPVSEATRVRMGCTRHWPLFLEVLLADEQLLRLCPELIAANVHGVLQERLLQDKSLNKQHAITGAMDEASAFEVRGWALDTCHPDSPVTVELLADGIRLATTVSNAPRPDVGELVGGEGNIGFLFQIPVAHQRAFGNGCRLTVREVHTRTLIGKEIWVQQDASHTWDLIAAAARELNHLRESMARIEAQLPDLRRMASLPLQAYDDYWRRFYRPTSDQLHEQDAHMQTWAYRPMLSVVMPTYQSSLQWLNQAIASVQAQTYPQWELVVCDDGSPDDSFFDILQRRYASDTRIRWVKQPHGGIARTTNAALALCQGDYVAFMDHDDLLAPDAMWHVVANLQNHRADWLYTDEDRVEEDFQGTLRHHSPAFKPAFDPDLLLSMNYICHWVVVKRDVLAKAGGLLEGFEGAQDHELLLRLSRTCQHENILHIPRVLYHWRVTPGSVSTSEQKQRAVGYAVVDAVDQHLRALGQDAMVSVHTDPHGHARLFATQVRWRLPSKAPTVTVIVPTRDGLHLLKPCIDSVLTHAHRYPGQTEVLIMDNGSEEPPTLAYFDSLAHDARVRIVRYEGKFNYSAINNVAALQAQGDVLVFLNNDTEVISPDWCVELVSQALRPEVGAVGARLLYQDHTIQHAGVLLGVEGLAGHEGLGDSLLHGGYNGRSQVLHGASAVTGACLATRKAVFLQLDGGFDDIELQVAFNDVDYCMRVREAGLRVVYTPFATLHHYESKSRGRELTQAQQARYHGESLALTRRWGDLRAADPFYNPHFERYALAFARLCPPPSAQARSCKPPQRCVPGLPQETV